MIPSRKRKNRDPDSVYQGEMRPKDPSLPLFTAEPRANDTRSQGRKLQIASLFSGIAGLEVGLHRSGHETLLMCENEPGARAVLAHHFPEIPLHEDVCDLTELPAGTEFLVGGFPCQDLSQAGTTAGINGHQSSLVDEAFRLIRTHDVPWLLLENVPFMLQLKRGEALDHIVTALEEMGYSWAYRVVDSRSMGIPQRRQRVYLLASKVGDPRDVLFVDDEEAPEDPDRDSWRETACGFYWTEGLRGLGWAYDAVPTLKCGSSIGIPSPPAIVRTSGEIVKPDLRDTEKMQGFPVDWTQPAETVMRPGHRWKLVGNAVTVDVAAWIGRRLVEPGYYDPSSDPLLQRRGSWPRAAWGSAGERYVASLSAWPCRLPIPPLEEFLDYPTIPLSERATAGFYSRAQRAKLRFPPGFLDLVKNHLDTVRTGA